MSRNAADQLIRYEGRLPEEYVVRLGELAERPELLGGLVVRRGIGRASRRSGVRWCPYIVEYSGEEVWDAAHAIIKDDIEAFQIPAQTEEVQVNIA